MLVQRGLGGGSILGLFGVTGLSWFRFLHDSMPELGYTNS